MGEGIQLHLSDEQFREAIASAILKQIDDVGRDKLIEGAIAYLITPTAAYDKQPQHNWKAPLEDVINAQVLEIAKQIVTESVNKEALLKKMKPLIDAAFEKVVGDEEGKGKTIDAMARVIRKALTGQDW